MEFKIETKLAEKFIIVMREAQRFGLRWMTFQIKNDQITSENWSAHRYQRDAYRNVQENHPDTHMGNIKDLLIEMHNVIEKSPQNIDQAVNFFELKNQLAELGFNEPNIVDQLRGIMLSEYNDHILYTDRDNTVIQINLNKDHLGNLHFHTYDMILTEGDMLRCDQTFAADVPVSEALILINYRLQHEDVSPLVASTPMDRQQVRVSIGLNPNEQISNQLTLEIMNTENLSYLQKQLLNLGFGEQMNEALEKQIQAKLPEFTLDASNTYNKQDVGYTLHFKAGDQNEMYFFNKYEAKLDDKQQTFYINQGSGITAKEAYNLMDGRAVYKELENRDGEKYKAWIILDKDNKAENGDLKLKTYSEGWNYKPERAIDKMDIVGINDDGARDKLMRSLEKGNRHQVEAVRDGKPVKVFLEANPAEHLVNITNYKGEPQKLDHYKKAELKPAAKQTDTLQQDASKKKTRGKKVSV